MNFDNRKITTYSRIGSRATFGMVALDLVKEYQNLMVLTADVSTSAGLDRFRKMYPDNYLDLGIAEQNMIGVATGLSSEGFNVITTTFAPFQTLRCLEQIKVNLGYMKHKVIMVGLASGLILGPLGYTHCCIEDLSIMRSIPNITVLSPADPFEAAKSVISAMEHDSSVYIRLTGGANVKKIYEEDYNFTIGQPVLMNEGEEITIFCTGQMVGEVLQTKEKLLEKNINPNIINIHTLKPINEDYILKYIKNSKLIVTVEEHNIYGALNSCIAEINSKSIYNVKHLPIAINDNYSDGGDYQYLIKKHGINNEKIVERILYEFRKFS